jgi:hypothetical protein
MKRKVMPSEYIAESYARLRSKYIQSYSKIVKEPTISQPLSFEKECWQSNIKNADKDGFYYQSHQFPWFFNQNPCLNKSMIIIFHLLN